MLLRPLILALSLATLAVAQPTTAPALPTLLDQLGDRDPSVRAQGRDGLMRLTRDDLPSLAAAAHGKSLNPTQVSLLHDVVVQVYLTGKHNFTGAGPGYLGIALLQSPEPVENNDQQAADAQAANGQPDGIAEPAAPPTRRGAIVQSRTAGCDAYRVLEVGDVITGLARVGSRDAKPKTYLRVDSFAQVRPLLATTNVGEWIALRVLRNGTELELYIRLAPRPPTDEMQNTISEVPEGDDYWQTTFKPAMTKSAATSRRSHRL